ncbi:hypothetical protein F2Q70_00023177 [Brassica cretica]|uniref:Uncharacterized protein n=1 Tax=Brassica cretica TaxID=69181 RepID=A0A8S9GNR7_BRACR|nr:hypothetical protein F2Q70_00023177 [Brassica cretica]
MHGFVSYRRFGRARLLCGDRTKRTLGRLEIRRYVATERDARLVATKRPSLARARSLLSGSKTVTTKLTFKTSKEENKKTFSDKYFFEIDSSLRKALRRKHETSDKSSKKVATQRPNAGSTRSLRSDRASVPLGRYVATERSFRLVAT